MLNQIPVGARYMILSALGFSLMGVFVKLAAARAIPVLEIVAARALISIFLSYGDIRRKKISALGHRRRLLLARGLVGTAALVCVYYSLSHLPIAEATVLQYLNPMFTVLLAFVFLGEAFTRSTAFCIALSFAGVLLIVQPEFLFGESTTEYPLLAIGAAVAGAIGSAVAYVLVRKLNETEDSSVIIFYFPMVAFPMSVLVLLLRNEFVMPTGWTWGILILVGVFTQIGQIGLTKAMKTLKAGKATSLSYMQVVFAIVFGIFFFDEIPTIWLLAGATLIFAGVFLNISDRQDPAGIKERSV